MKSCGKGIQPVQVGFFHGLPYTCYEVGHTWTPSCTKAALMTAQDSMVFSLKVYTTFYGGTALLKLLKKKNRKNFGKFLLKQILGIIQSSIFLSSNGTCYMIFFCIHRYIFKKFYRWHGALAGFSAGLFSIMLERKERRALLATYVSNLALEVLFRMGQTRSYLKGVDHGEVYIFSLASAGFMFLLRTPNGLSEYLRSPLEFVVGKSESCNSDSYSKIEKDEEKPKKASIIQKADNVIDQAISRLFHKLPCCKHPACRHDSGCMQYAIKGFARQFVVGYLIEFLLNIIRMVRSRKLPLSRLFKSRSLAMFLGTYAALFRLCNCLLRWVCNGDSCSLHGAVSGLVSGLAFYFYKSSTIALYFLCKLIEIVAVKACDAGYIPSFEHYDAVVYALALSVILSAAWIEPHNIRPGYWNFLLGVSGNRFPLMFRRLVPEFLPTPKTMYMDFIPDFQEKFVKSNRVREILRQFGKL